MSLNFKLIGQRIKESRNKKRMSQAELAEHVDVSVSYISRIETAKKQASLKTLEQIAGVLGVTIDHLLQANDYEDYKADLIQLIDDCTCYEKRFIYEIAFVVKKSLRDNEWLLQKDMIE